MTKSTQVIADLKSANSSTPTTTSVTAANAAAGPITDVPGMLDLLVTKAEELKLAIVQVEAAIDSGDPIYTLIDSVKQVLV